MTDQPLLPTKIVIGPHRFSVSDKWKDHQKACKSVGRDAAADGISNSQTGVVTINPHQSFAMRQDTLLHEVVHQAWRLLSWQMPNKMDEEYIVERLTAPLLDFIQRNPDAMQYLMETGIEPEFITPRDSLTSMDCDGRGVAECRR